MAIELGIAVIIAITLVMILLRIFFKTAYKILSIIWFVMFLGSVAFGILIYQDAKDLSENFADSENIFLLESGGEMLAGFVTKGGDEPEAVENLDKLQEYYEKNNFDAVLKTGDYYKMLIFSEDCFDTVSEIELGDGINISKDLLLDIMKSDNPIDLYADWLMEQRGYPSEFRGAMVKSLEEDAGITSSAKLRSVFFRMLFTAANLQQPFFIIDSYRNGKIIIYEETLTFKLIKNFPDFILEELIGGKRGG